MYIILCHSVISTLSLGQLTQMFPVDKAVVKICVPHKRSL